MSTTSGGAKEADNETKGSTSTPGGSSDKTGGGDDTTNVKRELIRRQTVLAVTKQLTDRTPSFRTRSNSNPPNKGGEIMDNERALELIFEELMVCFIVHFIFSFFICKRCDIPRH